MRAPDSPLLAPLVFLWIVFLRPFRVRDTDPRPTALLALLLQFQMTPRRTLRRPLEFSRVPSGRNTPRNPSTNPRVIDVISVVMVSTTFIHLFLRHSMFLSSL